MMDLIALGIAAIIVILVFIGKELSDIHDRLIEIRDLFESEED
jgi:hypothetical protein